MCKKWNYRMNLLKKQYPPNGSGWYSRWWGMGAPFRSMSWKDTLPKLEVRSQWRG